MATEVGDRRSGRTILVSVATIVAIILLAWMGKMAGPRFLGVAGGTRTLGVLAPLAFLLAYALAVVLLVPASILTVASGALFGFWHGTLYSLGGSVIGSGAAFLLGRHALHRFVAERLASMPRYAAIDRAVGAKGHRIVFLLRLSPVMPFNVLNYALGLTTISLADFLLASSGMLPGTIVYSYFGKVTGEAVALAGKAELPRDASYYVLLVAGLVATIGATVIVARTARRALRDV